MHLEEVAGELGRHARHQIRCGGGAIIKPSWTTRAGWSGVVCGRAPPSSHVANQVKSLAPEPVLSASLDTPTDLGRYAIGAASSD